MMKLVQLDAIVLFHDINFFEERKNFFYYGYRMNVWYQNIIWLAAIYYQYCGLLGCDDVVLVVTTLLKECITSIFTPKMDMKYSLKTDKHLQDHMASQSRRPKQTSSLPQEAQIGLRNVITNNNKNIATVGLIKNTSLLVSSSLI